MEEQQEREEWCERMGGYRGIQTADGKYDGDDADDQTNYMDNGNGNDKGDPQDSAATPEHGKPSNSD